MLAVLSVGVLVATKPTTGGLACGGVSGWSAFVGGNVSHQSKTNGAFGQIPIYDIKAYTLVDLRAGVESASGSYRLSIWGTNVFDTYYWQTASRNFDSDIHNAGQPARYGITFSYRYD